MPRGRRARTRRPRGRRGSGSLALREQPLLAVGLAEHAERVRDRLDHGRVGLARGHRLAAPAPARAGTTAPRSRAGRARRRPSSRATGSSIGAERDHRVEHVAAAARARARRRTGTTRRPRSPIPRGRARAARRARARAAWDRAGTSSAPGPGGRAATPRRAIGRPPGGRISVSSSAPPLQSSSRQSPSVRSMPAGGRDASARRPAPRARRGSCRRAAGGGRRCAAAARARGAPSAAGGCVGSSARSRGRDLVRVGDAGLVLLERRGALVERAHEQVGAESSPAAPRACRSRRPAGSARVLQVDRAGVPAGGHAHDRRRRCRASPAMIARSSGAGAAPARQQRRVHVDHLVVARAAAP